MVASNGSGWDHVSVCLLDRKGKFIERTVTWDEMCEIKRLFFRTDEQVVEFHPRKQDYIDDHHYVLHIWKSNVLEFPLPDKKNYEANENFQYIILPRKNGFYNVITTETKEWKRVRVSLLDKYYHPLDRYPKWDEMCLIKEMLFNDDEAVIEIHTNDEFKMYEKDYTIDLWRPLNKEMPLPNPDLVGKVKKYPNK